MSWADDLDLLGQRARLWRGSWGLLVAGALAVTMAEREHARLLADHAEAEAHWQQVQRLQRRLARDEAAAAAAEAARQGAGGEGGEGGERGAAHGRAGEAARASDAARAGTSGGLTTASRAAADAERDTAAALQQARALVQRLAHPWGAVLGGVEAGVSQVAAGADAAAGIPPAVALLALTHDVPEGGAALVTLEAAVADDATAWRLVEALGAAPAFEEALLLSRETLAQPEAGLPLRVKLQARLRVDGLEAEAAP